MGIIKNLFMPNAYVQSVFDIDIEKLASMGVKGIITDLDNTLLVGTLKSLPRELKSGSLKRVSLVLQLQLCRTIMKTCI